MKNILLCCLLMIAYLSQAQFAPAANQPGTTAISKDSSCFVAWATGCSIQRGLMDIAKPDSGYASVGDSNSAIGMAQQNGIVSLGDGGSATLTFAKPVYNGPGFDFAVFENGFYTSGVLAFLEFAFVEVSSDGNNFFRFPATSNIQDTSQMAMVGVDCSLVNNLAGKYVSGFGTPFDLEELKNEIGLDVNNITHVRLIDVIGSIDSAFATRDQFGKKINDPYPTLFASSGFDLDAVGVIHSGAPNDLAQLQVSGFRFQLYPNPVLNADVQLKADESLVGSEVEIYNAVGGLVSRVVISSHNSKLETRNFPSGLYFVQSGTHVAKLIVE